MSVVLAVLLFPGFFVVALLLVGRLFLLPQDKYGTLTDHITSLVLGAVFMGFIAGAAWLTLLRGVLSR